MKNKKRKFEPTLFEQVIIEDFAAEGKCIARINGEVIFIENNAAPGDVADLRLTNVRRNFKEAAIETLIQPSPLRTEPFCAHFGVCGGCKWQHIQYDEQLKAKTQQVADALLRIGKLSFPEVLPILGAQKTTFYRNKLEYTFSKHRWLTREEMQSGLTFDRDTLGFHIPKRFDKILEIDHCYLQPDPSNAIRLALNAFAKSKGFEFYDAVKQEGFARNVVIRTASTNDLMVTVIFGRPQMDDINATMEMLQRQFPQITSLNYIINTKLNDTYHDLEVVNVVGKPYIEEQMEGLTFRIGAKSFYQTNAEQAYELYRVTRQMAQLTGQELVFDLYTGTGTIANFVARQARKVIGIEYVASAIEDAKVNSALNGITNTEFYAGDMKKFLTTEFVAEVGRPDVVITDPPRAGMDREVVEVLLHTRPERIVYVSCNPATQARDLALMDAEYAIAAVQPVDMFPHTHHVENVVSLVRR